MKPSHQFCETRSLSTSDKYSKTSLYSKISVIGHPSKSVVPELEKWVESGKKTQVAKLQNIIQDLRKRRRYGHALEVLLLLLLCILF